jgi:hypothetical protein
MTTNEERNLVRKINRRLARDGEKLRKIRNDRYLIIDIEHNVLLWNHVSIEALANELKISN